MVQVGQPSKTQRVYLSLRDRIAAGRFAGEGRLPGEESLAREYEVSRVTVRRAIDGLVDEGLVEKRAGSGSFVKRPDGRVQAAIADVSNVFAHLKEMGRNTEVRLLSFEYVQPDARVREALALEPDERVQRSHRVRLVEGVPFSYLIAQVPERIGRLYSREELSQAPLLELIERSGLAAASARQEVSAALAAPDVAAALEVEINSALVTLTRCVLDAHGQPLEHLEAQYRPDHYSFQMDLIRSRSAGGSYWSPADRRQSAAGAGEGQG